MFRFYPGGRSTHPSTVTQTSPPSRSAANAQANRANHGVHTASSRLGGEVPNLTSRDFIGEKPKKDLLVLVNRYVLSKEDKSVVTPKGVLVLGPKNVGKAYLSRVVAGQMGMPYYYYNMLNLFQSFKSGNLAALKRSIYSYKNFLEKTYKQKKPSIVCIEHAGAYAYLEQLELPRPEGFIVGTSPVLVHSPKDADIFQRIISLSVPTANETTALLTYMTRHIQLDADVSMRYLTDMTRGVVAGDLKTIIQHARRFASLENQPKVNMGHFINAIHYTINPQLHPKRHVDIDTRRNVARYHAAKALVAHVSGQHILHISIQKRANTNGGQLQLRKNLQSIEGLLDSIHILVSGLSALNMFSIEDDSLVVKDIKEAEKLVGLLIDKLGSTAEDRQRNIISVIERSVLETEVVIRSNLEVYNQLVEVLVEKHEIRQDDFLDIMRNIDSTYRPSMRK